jgi:hypothetical protein
MNNILRLKDSPVHKECIRLIESDEADLACSQFVDPVLQDMHRPVEYKCHIFVHEKNRQQFVETFRKVNSPGNPHQVNKFGAVLLFCVSIMEYFRLLASPEVSHSLSRAFEQIMHEKPYLLGLPTTKVIPKLRVGEVPNFVSGRRAVEAGKVDAFYYGLYAGLYNLCVDDKSLKQCTELLRKSGAVAEWKGAGPLRSLAIHKNLLQRYLLAVNDEVEIVTNLVAESQPSS